jgi:DNA-binding response OmpR family regulator
MKAVDRKRSRTVLMVESDVLVRQPIAEYLRHCGYKVIEARDTDEALLILTSGGIDIVLADVQAAGNLDGFGLARWIRKNQSSVKVILAGTVASEAKEAGNLCEEGPQLMKPYDPQNLVNQIKRALAARDRADKT